MKCGATASGSQQHKYAKQNEDDTSSTPQNQPYAACCQMLLPGLCHLQLVFLLRQVGRQVGRGYHKRLCQLAEDANEAQLLAADTHAPTAWPDPEVLHAMTGQVRRLQLASALDLRITSFETVRFEDFHSFCSSRFWKLR
jgi:hypothetical protein